MQRADIYITEEDPAMDDTALLNVGLALVDAYEAQDVLAIGKVWAEALSDSQGLDTAPHLRSQAHTTPSFKSRAAHRDDIREQNRWWKVRKQEIVVAEFKLSREIALRNR